MRTSQSFNRTFCSFCVRALNLSYVGVIEYKLLTFDCSLSFFVVCWMMWSGGTFLYMFSTRIGLIELSALDMCVGGYVSAPQIISTIHRGNPSLTDAVTTLLCQNAVAWADQNIPPPPAPCALSRTSPDHLPLYLLFCTDTLDLDFLYCSQETASPNVMQVMVPSLSSEL